MYSGVSKYSGRTGHLLIGHRIGAGVSLWAGLELISLSLFLFLVHTQGGKGNGSGGIFGWATIVLRLAGGQETVGSPVYKILNALLCTPGYLFSICQFMHCKYAVHD